MKSSNQPSSPASSTNIDRLASTFAVALSIAALFISIIEVSSERAQQRASVWPHIQISESYSEAGFRVVLTNKGVGPALLGELTLLHDGQPVADIDQLIIDTIGAENAFSYDRYSMSNPGNSVVAPGESINLFGVGWDDSSRQLIRAWNGRIDIATCYCSIHEDCWQASLAEDTTSRIERCDTGVAL
ncbi:MAG: hypothetical protein AAAFM81_12775 [Pseudomonadota bacterium]